MKVRNRKRILEDGIRAHLRSFPWPWGILSFLRAQSAGRRLMGNWKRKRLLRDLGEVK
jgi:hypothetical protein